MMGSWLDLKANNIHYFHPLPAYFINTKYLNWLNKYVEIQYDRQLRNQGDG